MKNDFYNDLDKGKEIERLVCQLIRTKYPKAYLVDEGYKNGDFNDRGFDILVPEKKITVEVKYDEKSNSTTNFFIETQSQLPDGTWKKSGISVTNSEWWVQVNNDYIVWVLTDSLHYMIREFKLRELPFNKVNPPKKGYLIPKNKMAFSPYVKFQERKKCLTCPF